MWIQVLLLTPVLISWVHGDIHLHNMRGSNNRGDGESREVRNNRRLYNSQNNNRGGYNVGPGMEYYAGSIIRIEWTNQHSCGGPNNNCELIVQYMCDDKIRDGTTTKTIPEINSQCRDNSCNTDLRYGMHEDYEYYEKCRYTKRNRGLFTSTQNLRQTAKYTRQQPHGSQYGYECPEEREYYPYWRPTPWRDVVIFTNDKNRCKYYEDASQNTEPRYECKPPPGYMEYVRTRGDDKDYKDVEYIPITEGECVKLTTPGSTTGEAGRWEKVPPHNVGKPDCKLSAKSRDNHNGNGIDGVTNFYEWTLPLQAHPQCVMRMRYNISTNDFNAWDTTVHDNSGPEIHQNLGWHETTAREHGYTVKKDPIVHPFRVLVNGQDIGRKFKLKLAIDVAQYGRTFQDRSHAFSIIPRPPSVQLPKKIYNVNVRGKRGNIVQTYPATEYDFVPNNLTITCGNTYLHFQWTGSDANNNDNNGQGRRKTDRSNVCLMGPNKYVKSFGHAKAGVHGHYGVSYPADMRTGDNFLGVDNESEQRLCSSGTRNGDNAELDDAGPYYNHKHHVPTDGGLVRCRCEPGPFDGRVAAKVKGVWYYLCTRNNNFTNRSQKAKIVCE